MRQKDEVVRFIVQYEAFINGKWRVIVRYDNSHGFAHKDIIHSNGEVDKQPLYFKDFNMAFTFAIQDLKTAWKWYKVAYKREMENEEGRKLLRVEGAISIDDLRLMSKAIEEGCEKADIRECKVSS